MEQPRDDGPPVERETLWIIPAAPTVWAAHFVACYGTAAVWCAKAASRDAALGPTGGLIGLYTVLALALIAWIGVKGWRRHSLGTATTPHDFATHADRHRFLGFATLLLAGLSFIATLFVAAGPLVIGTCR